MAAKLIAFDTGHLLERGTDVAMWDYAHFSEVMLGHRALILCPAAADVSCLDRFRQRFSVGLYRDRQDQAQWLRDVDVYYVQAHGHPPRELPPRPPHGTLAVHCVFKADRPWGDVCATISECVSHRHGDGSLPVVPYVVHWPEAAVAGARQRDLRAELGISSDAVVIGRHGGRDTFNIPWVREVVAAVARRRRDLHFVFLGTRPFAAHERIHYLPSSADVAAKLAFIDACDAMLHARWEGETFGLAVAEFSTRNKPVLTWAGDHPGYDDHHLQVLGARARRYRDPLDLAQQLYFFAPTPGDHDAYSEHYAPSVVMPRFAEVFLAAAQVTSSPAS